MQGARGVMQEGATVAKEHVKAVLIPSACHESWTLQLVLVATLPSNNLKNDPCEPRL